MLNLFSSFNGLIDKVKPTIQVREQPQQEQ